jgi:hypothetical protein
MATATATITEIMKAILAGLLWTLLFFLLLVGIDQLLVRVPFESPAPLAVATFYRDLRSRVLDLTRGMTSAPAPSPAKPTKPLPASPGKAAPPASIEGIIEQHQAKPAATRPPSPAVPAKLKPATQAKDSAPRYVYADDGGELHFAATLSEIPEQYRERAKPLGK